MGGIPDMVRVYRERIDDEAMAALRLYFLSSADLPLLGELNESALAKPISA